MATEPLQAAPYPATTDAPDGPAQTLALALWARLKVVQVYASAAARTSAFSAAGVSATEGMISYRQDVDVFEEYDGSAWVPLTEGDTWTSMGTPSGWSTAAGSPQWAYRKVRRRVWLRGAMNMPASDTAVSKFTFPAGFRPAAGIATLAVPYSNGTAISGHMRFDVATTGTFTLRAVGPGSGVLAAFDGLSYALD